MCSIGCMLVKLHILVKFFCYINCATISMVNKDVYITKSLAVQDNYIVIWDRIACKLTSL